MSAYNNNVKQACLNPLADSSNNNHNHYSGMTHNDQGLRAASHVSMEHTALAHEYNPTCGCHDCQDILSNFTQYHVLDAYTAEHLRFEASVQAAYGYVPAKGTPYNYAVRNVCVGQDETTGENVYEQHTEYANRYFFHFHLHQMNPIAAEVKERSYQRFFENNNNNNNNNTVAAAPAIPAPRYKQQQQQQYNNNNNNNTKSGNGLARAFATHQNVYNNNNNNNNNNNSRRNNNQQQQQTFNNNNNNNNYVSNNFQNYYAAPVPQQHQQNNFNAFYYTPSDVDQAAQDVAYNQVATLGN